MRFVWPLFVLLASSTGLLAQSRYEIDGNTLTLDMTVAAPGYDFDGGLDAYDETEVISYLFDHPEIKPLRVTGPGGYETTLHGSSSFCLTVPLILLFSRERSVKGDSHNSKPDCEPI